jgi:hypothetical protein
MGMLVIQRGSGGGGGVVSPVEVAGGATAGEGQHCRQESRENLHIFLQEIQREVSASLCQSAWFAHTISWASATTVIQQPRRGKSFDELIAGVERWSRK